MKLYTADKETGTFIDEVESVDEGLKLIEEYETTDREDGNYTPDFYDVVNEEHSSVIYKGITFFRE